MKGFISRAWPVYGILVLVLLAFSMQAVLTPTLAQGPGDWPMYQHDPAHSGRTAATIPSNGPLYLQWAYSFGERVEVEVQPVIANGVVYVGAMNGEMHAINADTGATVWIKRPGGPIPHTAAFANDVIYFGSLDGTVYALNTADGATRWQFPTGGPVMSAPAVVDGRVFIGSNDGNLYVLDAATGSELWHVSTGSPVVSSPAVVNGFVYFGSEDLKARCVEIATQTVRWTTQLYGYSMHNTHPIVSDNGQVVIFVTVKPGGSSYVPLEGYPNTSSSADPVQTWNSYYQANPKYRTLYYLDATTGADKWNATTRRYVPLPIPYWGLLAPVLGPDGAAYFPAPSGANDPAHNAGAYYLDHDNRLFRVDLGTGVAAQIAGGLSLPEFQHRSDEVGRGIFAGSNYYTAISEDVGVFFPATGQLVALYGNNFGNHMNPLSPLPSRHLWRYGGAIAMGGVPAASAPIVVNNTMYYLSYGWLYAVGPTNRGLNPATSFPARDARLNELTYPRSVTPTTAQIQAELERRVNDLIALGPANFPMTARWEQAGDQMTNNESNWELYGHAHELVRVLAAAYPHLPSDRQAALKTYLGSVMSNTLLNAAHYQFTTHCLIFGESGRLAGDAACNQSNKIIARWGAGNLNIVGLNLYAVWAYAEATGDWASVQAKWTFLKGQFQSITQHYNATLGFYNPPRWQVGRLNLPAQIAATEAMRNMAAHFGDTTTQSQAQTLLNSLLNRRVSLQNTFVTNLYNSGVRQPASIRLNPDGTINNSDIMTNGPYNNELIPYSAAVRNKDTDPSQVSWWDGQSCTGSQTSHCIIDASVGFMHYQALVGYFPLTPELIARLQRDLLDKTRYYVKSYEVNLPWWWMSDLAHHTTAGGEHLYTSPTLAWTLFQVKARVLQEDWNTLAAQLPEPMSANSRYDLYRLENLVTLLDLASPSLDQSGFSVAPVVPHSGQVVTYTLTIRRNGVPFPDVVSVSDTVPGGLSYVAGSLTASRGTVNDSSAPQLQWSGALSETNLVTVSFSALVTVPADQVETIYNTASIHTNPLGTITRSIPIFVNGRELFLSILLKN